MKQVGIFRAASMDSLHRIEDDPSDVGVASPRVQLALDLGIQPSGLTSFSGSGIELYVYLEIEASSANVNSPVTSQLTETLSQQDGVQELDSRESGNAEVETAEICPETDLIGDTSLQADNLSKCENCQCHGFEVEKLGASQHSELVSDQCIVQPDVVQEYTVEKSGTYQQSELSRDAILAKDVPSILPDVVQECIAEKSVTSQQSELGREGILPDEGQECEDEESGIPQRKKLISHQFISQPDVVQECAAEKSVTSQHSELSREAIPSEDVQDCEDQGSLTLQHKELINHQFIFQPDVIQERAAEKSETSEHSESTRDAILPQDVRESDGEKSGASQHAELISSTPLKHDVAQECDNRKPRAAQHSELISDAILQDINQVFNGEKLGTSQHEETVGDPVPVCYGEKFGTSQHKEAGSHRVLPQTEVEEVDYQASIGDKYGPSKDPAGGGNQCSWPEWGESLQDLDYHPGNEDKGESLVDQDKPWSSCPWPEWGEPLPPEDFDVDLEETSGEKDPTREDIDLEETLGEKDPTPEDIDLEKTSGEKDPALKRVVTFSEVVTIVEASNIQEERETGSFSYLGSSDDEAEPCTNQVLNQSNTDVSSIPRSSAENVVDMSAACQLLALSDDRIPGASGGQTSDQTVVRERSLSEDAGRRLDNLSELVEKIYAALPQLSFPVGTHGRVSREEAGIWTVEVSNDLRLRMKRVRPERTSVDGSEDFDTDMNGEVLDRPPCKRQYRSLLTLL